MYASANVPSFDVMVDIITKKVRPGEKVKAALRIINVGGPRAKVDVFVAYSIKDLEDNMIEEKTKTIAVVEQKEEILSLYVPDDTKPGKYIFETCVTYTGREALSTETFYVVGEEQAFKPTGMEIYIFLAMIGIIIVFMLVRSKRR